MFTNCLRAQSLLPRAFLDCELPGGRQILGLFECPLLTLTVRITYGLKTTCSIC